MPKEKEEKKFELSPSVSIIVAGVLIAGSIVFVNLHPAPQAAAEGSNQETASVPAPRATDHIRGSLNAPIVLIEYSDFQCPYCKMIDPTLKRVVSESNGGVAWIYRQYPLYQIHPQALPAANASECIAEQLGNDGFWKFADTIFDDQSKMNESFYASLAKEYGADPQKYAACISAKTYNDKIMAEIGEAGASGGNGTPYTIVYNTKTGKQLPISGALPYEQIKAVISQAQ